MAQLTLFPKTEKQPERGTGSKANKLDSRDRAFHDWYRFILSFPPHLVREYIQRFGLRKGQTILDPFCGTGTTLVEAKKLGLAGVGLEANPMAHFASSVKIDWSADSDELVEHALNVAGVASKEIDDKSAKSYRSLSQDSYALLLKDSISPLPLHKALALLEAMKRLKDERFYGYEMLALAKALVFSASNLHFGPEVGVQRSKKTDAPVLESWLAGIKSMAEDLNRKNKTDARSVVYLTDSRKPDEILQSASIDAVFTSPPYPNEKDYTRTTRLESVILGFINNRAELQALKKCLLRSNTRNVYKGDDDDAWISDNEEVQSIAAAIEKRRIELGKTSGFEKLYGRVTRRRTGAN